MKRLFYLEDDAALASITGRTLRRAGFDVSHCDTIEGAHPLMQQKAFDCALLDLKIGNKTSLDLIANLKKTGIERIVVLTGYGTIRAAVQAMKLGAVDFLSKPCSSEEIIAALCGKADTVTLSEHQQITRPSLRNTEWEAIQKALDENNGNISATARQLNLHRRTLQRKLQKRHSEPSDPE